jgi:hypothetical protein
MHFVIFVQKDYSNDLIRDDLKSLPVPQNLAWFNDYWVNTKINLPFETENPQCNDRRI